LFLRSSLTEEPTIVTDLDEIRAFLSKIQLRILKPEYIYLPDMEEGDMLMWDNYGLFHSAVDYPDTYGSRSMHQANIGASVGPRGPVNIPM
jgi:alpha-ketoglutarate-dependent taurine dioxygenase